MTELETHLYIKIMQGNRTLEFSYDFEGDSLQEYINAFYDAMAGLGYHTDTLNDYGISYN